MNKWFDRADHQKFSAERKSFMSKKHLSQYNLYKIWLKKILGPKKFWVQQYFESKQMLYSKTCGSKKTLGPKKNWVKQNYDSQPN